MPVVPGNSLQRQINENERSHLRPSPYIEVPKRCIIEKVYDVEAIEAEGGVPSEIAEVYVRGAGLIYARVRLRDESDPLYLPFAKDGPTLMAEEGSAMLIEGRPARILYRGGDVQRGVIELTANPSQRMRHPDALAGVASILDIFA